MKDKKEKEIQNKVAKKQEREFMDLEHQKKFVDQIKHYEYIHSLMGIIR